MKLVSLLCAGALVLCASSCIFTIGGGSHCDECEGGRTSLSLSRGVHASGRHAREQRQVEAYTRLEVRCSAEVELRVAAGEPTLEVSADEALLAHVLTRVVDGVLVVEMEKGVSSSAAGARVVARVPSLEGVVLEGSGDVRVEGLNGARFEAQLRGSGDLVLLGAVDEAELVLEGSGDMDAYGLDARSLRARLAGSGDMELSAREALDVELRGSGDVRYRGEPPTVRARVLGSGSIERS